LNFSRSRAKSDKVRRPNHCDISIANIINAELNANALRLRLMAGCLLLRNIKICPRNCTAIPLVGEAIVKSSAFKLLNIDNLSLEVVVWFPLCLTGYNLPSDYYWEQFRDAVPVFCIPQAG